MVAARSGSSRRSRQPIYARTRLGLDVENCGISQSRLADVQFDFITMWDVVEHLYDPRGDLGFLLPKLKPGGRLFITTDDTDSWLARLTGPRYQNLMYQHLFHLTKKTLSHMLRESGYEVLTAQSYFRSWSLRYLFRLVPKLWWRGPATRVIQGSLPPLMKVAMLRELRIAIPVSDYINLVAARPV